MDRSLPVYLQGKQVSVYRNLTRRCLSIKYKQHVAGHAISVVLENVIFKVSEAGRQRVLRTRQKNVHAFVQGALLQCSQKDFSVEFIDGKPIQISYNPYKASYFYERSSEAPVHKARICVISSSGILAYL